VPELAAAEERAPLCLIVNPAAGGGRAGRAAEEVTHTLRRPGLRTRREDTRDLAHARELALQAAHAGEIVVTLGGDGLVGAVADAVRHVSGAVLGVLPGGRGNDLARVLGIPLDPIAACAVIANGIPRRMDVGEIDGRTFVGIASVGFDSDANRIANEAPSRLGNLVYAYGALRAMWSWSPVRFQVDLEPSGERVNFTGYSVATANSRAFGGGMYLAPDAVLNDGLFDVVLIEQAAKLRYLWNLPKAFRGTHVRLANVRVLRAAEVQIAAERPFTMYADGDPIGELPVHVRSLAGAVTVLTPVGEPASSTFLTDAAGRSSASGARVRSPPGEAPRAAAGDDVG
jgi:YegS/Rv2252/BmrU family lipid kinase